MVAYSFKDYFCDPIVRREKRQTVRAYGKRRHAGPGDQVQLYTRMRRPDCAKIIPDVLCKGRDQVHFDLRRPTKMRLTIEGKDVELWTPAFHDFARADGFGLQNGYLPAWCRDVDRFARWIPPEQRTTCGSAFVRFWLATHGALFFEGCLIKWEDV